jgi:nickel-dependent lactate racemase
MRVAVEFQDESVEFELHRERVLGSWRGPARISQAAQRALVDGAIEQPWEYPPMRQLVVPGDRVAIALDAAVRPAEPLLSAIGRTLSEAGVAPHSLTVLAPERPDDDVERALPPGASIVLHDPDARDQLAYLATTKQGRRIYLNRVLTDADVVIAVGRMGFDAFLGYRGPWSVLFPGLSDRPTMAEHRMLARDENGAQPRAARGRLDESFEVSWLLGSQFHVALVPGSVGFAEVIAGRESSVRERGIAGLEQHWTFETDARADTVVVGIGSPGAVSGMDSLGQGLLTATRLVRRGGRIVALSRATGEMGPSLRALGTAGHPSEVAGALKGHERDPDYLVARRIAHALTWADVYLLSELDQEVADDLSFVSLESPEQARRLVTKSDTCLFVSQADLVHAQIKGEGH